MSATLRIAIFVLALVLSCCATRATYRVAPNADDVPSFVILPFDHTTAQREYASVVEQAFLSFGFEVYTPTPREKEVETRDATTSSSAQGGAVETYGAMGTYGAGAVGAKGSTFDATGSGTQSEAIDRYFESEGTTATYVVQSYGKTYPKGAGYVYVDARLKIWDAKTRRVVAAFRVKPHYEAPYIYKALQAVGMPVEVYAPE